MSDDFAAKLHLMLDHANLSRTRLAKLVGVDKSVTSRWLAGSTRPSDANREALTRGLGKFVPALRLSDWSLPLDEFRARLVTASPVTSGTATQRVPLSSMDAQTPSPSLDRPAILVLPFANLSGDPNQEFFGDGIAQDILTELSKRRWLLVIARNTSFTYRGSIDVRQVGRDLGVRYVLEGSIRRMSNRVRVAAQLVEATNGVHVWAERYDRDLSDVFAVQDEITSSVALAIEPAIVQAERARAVRKPPDNLDAWEAYQRGMWHLLKSDADNTAIARRFFERAIKLDPYMVAAYTALAAVFTSSGAIFRTVPLDEAVARAESCVRQALSLDNNDGMAQAQHGMTQYLHGAYQDAIASSELAMASCPSCDLGLRVQGYCFLMLGRYGDARAHLERSMQLNPCDAMRPNAQMQYAATYYLEEDYGLAAKLLRDVIRRHPGHPTSYLWLIATLGQLGEQREAASIMAIAPTGYDKAARERLPFYSAVVHRGLLVGLKKSGWH